MTLFLFGSYRSNGSDRTVLGKMFPTIEQDFTFNAGCGFCDCIILSAMYHARELLRGITSEPEVIKEGVQVFADCQFL